MEERRVVVVLVVEEEEDEVKVKVERWSRKEGIGR